VFAFQDTRGPVRIAFTDRHGGSSGGPFASLNLGDHTGDSTDVVRRNLEEVAAAFAGDAPTPRIALMRQVHGSHVHVVDGVDDADDVHDPARHEPEADALVTGLPHVVLVVRVADCVPVVLADPGAGVVGVAHAGRQGLAAGVVGRTVEAMRDLGARDVTGWVGPHVCGDCYEVPDELRAEVAAAVPESFACTRHGTPALDIGAGVVAQLRRADVEVVDVSRCTMEDDDLYSHRRQGPRSGRLAGLVVRRR